MTHANSLPALTPIGENSTPIWGMTNAERLRRLARAEGLPETVEQAGARLYVNLAYVFDPVWLRHIRSEEHTSELQSLMRISYAVFCLKKKLQNQHHNTTQQNEY